MVLSIHGVSDIVNYIVASIIFDDDDGEMGETLIRRDSIDSMADALIELMERRQNPEVLFAVYYNSSPILIKKEIDVKTEVINKIKEKTTHAKNNSISTIG